MTTSDVTVQDGLKHPYFLALVRWCVSSFWTTASVILHRLMTARIPQVKGARQCRSRPASYGHLHPEPRVQCEVLHAPRLLEDHTLDVIFVHGLYGSLGNTWRQGEWQTKYDRAPKKVPLRRPHSTPTCQCTDERTKCCSDNKSNIINEETDETSEQNTKNTTDTEIYRRNGDEQGKYNENDNILSEVNDERGSNSNKNGNNATQNEKYEMKYCDIERSDRIRQKNLKDDMDVRKNGFSIVTNDKFIDKRLDSDVRIPPSTIPKSISDINIKKDYVNGPGEDIVNGEVQSNLYDNIQKILPKENQLITEKFYNNTLLDDVDIGSYETQAQFVKDLFENSVKVKSDESESGVKASDCKCEEKCDVGCGCVCDDCYSPCWPRDWIRVDYPGARVISINYTSDPYLWRPLWVKESKRLRLHERAEQMMSQLLELGVGERPVIWVGHSKGGLFIKKIYCDAYEAHLKLTKQNATKEENSKPTNEQNTTECRNDNEINHFRDKLTDKINVNLISDVNLNEINNRDGEFNGNDIENQRIDDMNLKEFDQINVSAGKNDINSNKFIELNDTVSEIVNRHIENTEVVVNSYTFDEILIYNETEVEGKDIYDDNGDRMIVDECDKNGNIPDLTADGEGKELFSHKNAAQLEARARVWRRSAGFMFYSVPHRGSPLADIKTPITARSVELMEICKDCPLVLSLQDSWSVATAPTTPPVRSVVETCRTLMSVLYLRIVSVDSADPGIGSLHGVDVDHREICKPSSRSCLLYRELMTLMEAALNRH